jgi:hypothetical protein
MVASERKYEVESPFAHRRTSATDFGRHVAGAGVGAGRIGVAVGGTTVAVGGITDAVAAGDRDGAVVADCC